MRTQKKHTTLPVRTKSALRTPRSQRPLRASDDRCAGWQCVIARWTDRKSCRADPLYICLLASAAREHDVEHAVG